jgi:hypothetical protein
MNIIKKLKQLKRIEDSLKLYNYLIEKEVSVRPFEKWVEEILYE